MEAAGATRSPWACPEGRGPGAARHEGGGGAPGGRTQCPPPAAARGTHLLLRQVQELSLGLLHVRGGAPDDDRVAARALHGEVDVDPATLLHDGADQAALRADEGVVQLGRDRDLRLGYVGLESHAARGSHVCVWPGRASAQGPGPWAGGHARRAGRWPWTQTATSASRLRPLRGWQQRPVRGRRPASPPEALCAKTPSLVAVTPETRFTSHTTPTPRSTRGGARAAPGCAPAPRTKLTALGDQGA